MYGKHRDPQDMGIFTSWEAAYNRLCESIKAFRPSHEDGYWWEIKGMVENPHLSSFSEASLCVYAEQNPLPQYRPSGLYQKLIFEEDQGEGENG
jgi:hypothetical protein